MNGKVLQILEFNKIIEKLIAYASCEPGVKLCSKLRPSNNSKKSGRDCGGGKPIKAFW